MHDYETIMLAGGPADGQHHNWDGGDYFTLEEKPRTPVLPNATEAMKNLMIRDHTYIRDKRLRTREGYAVFVWKGW